jgi:hypothetical protein
LKYILQNNVLVDENSFFKNSLPCGNVKRMAIDTFAMRLSQTHDKLCVFAMRRPKARGKG